MERRLIIDDDLKQPWEKDKQLEDDVKFYFGSDKDFSLRYDSANDRWVLRDEVNATEFVFPRNINRNIGIMGNGFDSGDVSCAVGTGGSASRTTLISLASGQRTLPPFAVYMEVGGTVASGETVSISVKAIFDDGTELEIASYSVTGATGSSTVGADKIWANLLTNARSAGVSLNGKRITSIVADVSSSATTTSATATVRVIGIGM